MFARLGSWCFRKRRRVVVAVGRRASLVVGGISSAVGGNFGQDFEPPGFESTRGLDILENEFGDQVGSGIPGTIVFRAEQGVDDPEVAGGAWSSCSRWSRRSPTTPTSTWHRPRLRPPRRRRARRRSRTPTSSMWEGITVVSPYDAATEPQIATAGRRRRQDRLRQPRDPRRRLGGRRHDRPHPRGGPARPSTACRSSSAARPSASSRSPPPRPSVWPSRS